MHGQRRNGASGGASDAGQGFQCLDVLWEFAAVILRYLFCSLVQVARSGVIAQASPQVQHLVYAGICQCSDIGILLHETKIVGNDRLDLGLLQHDFRDPDPVGRWILLPG